MFQLPKLPYDYNALEPYIDEMTMRLHHTKHHQTYVDKLNAGLANHKDLLEMNVDTLMKMLDKVPEDVKKVVRNHGGGHSNHTLFWTIMTPKKGSKPTGKSAKALDDSFGSFDQFKEKFSTTATNIFGSGWAWLAVDNNKLSIVDTPNQDTPLSMGKTPIFALDVWEHAYYLKYQNRRPEYIAAWWNVVNWEEVERRFEEGQK